MTTDYTRTVEAPDAVAAQEMVRFLAGGDGLRVRTVKSVRLVKPGDPLTGLATYTVTLAVEPRALVPEGSECG